MRSFVEIWRSYTHEERRNIAFYVGGIMFYKLGLEFFNGSITTLATDRFAKANTFTKLGAAQGVNQAAQCVGAILIAPLIVRFPTRTVLGVSVLFFSLMTMILLVVDAATGGKMRESANSPTHYGSWNPNAIFIIWTLSGVAYGMVELIRRVIPCDIVGGNVGKLRRMDATVHIFYEVTGTAAAFASSSAISRFGNNYSFFLSPVFFALAGAVWFFVSVLNYSPCEEYGLDEVDRSKRSKNYLIQVGRGISGFGESIWVGTMMVLGNRRFVWLVPGYALALYLHRFLENTLAPAFAKRALGVSAWSQIIVGGSNFGELLGALTVFLLSDVVTTPIPWLRLDALMLNIVWVLPHLTTITGHTVDWAWRLAGIFIPISMSWAAGDVSLSAYIQAALSTGDASLADRYPGVSHLGAVMAFLYSTYIILYAVLSSVLGDVIDKDFSETGNIKDSLRWVAGIQYSICCCIIMIATFIPKGAFSINPKMINGVRHDGFGHQEDESLKDFIEMQTGKNDGSLNVITT
ncbi:uncharacterized protein BT62DRAFT_770006 [Guyanagaster necrorhizus]|uniref:Uncharacterized protein n=1 Tax=Guyanagaster necrorhizus TaxID=856835 RepID=A0A9P7VF62_9AGAR|nr:uncharacterized protein BT62DRAFT_770006 [Guyanagaster necrorhizus MCA 3950]KAG7439275.1 hypothetical protein BT62DRAFT_770006 [Guyanagaster necrorhizus MCA 3950]